MFTGTLTFVSTQQIHACFALLLCERKEAVSFSHYVHDQGGDGNLWLSIKSSVVAESAEELHKPVKDPVCDVLLSLPLSISIPARKSAGHCTYDRK